MTKNLVIVESPAKARTIERYLGEDYRVLATYGHVRDLPENPGKGKLGVDVEHDFAPQYVITESSRRQVADITRAAKSADTVFLATDLDREGEAIAWHVAEAAGVPAAKQRRVTFSEITEGAIREAFANPRAIDMDLVDAQQTRRIVDRMVGYTLSPLISRKVRSGLSAGRVQSVAVRLVVEREREIEAFAAREYWTLAGGPGDRATARPSRPTSCASTGGRSIVAARSMPTPWPSPTRPRRPPSWRSWPAPRLASTRSPRGHSAAARRRRSRPARCSRRPAASSASAPSARCPSRSGSTRASRSTAARSASSPTCAPTRRPSPASPWARPGRSSRDATASRTRCPRAASIRTKSKGAQEAHEAIRPTSFRRDPESMARFLKPEELRLYRLIWQRAIASQMAAKEMETTSVELEAGRFGLRASATRTLFDGFSRVYTEGRDDDDRGWRRGRLAAAPGRGRSRPPCGTSTPSQHFTEPPPRFTEATLIKALEEHGIGRPSTYAATISTIVDRGYVVVQERRLYPELVAGIVTDLLVEHFGEFVDVEFTARMEERLDEVARGERAWVPLAARVLRAAQGARRREAPRAQARRLHDRGDRRGLLARAPMVIRLGRNGRFLACSLYPEHKESRPLPGEEAPPMEGEGEPCPECGQGVLAQRRGRFGAFLGCSRYPDCGYIKRTGPPPPEQLPFEVACPKNGEGHLVARRARRTGNVFWGCSRYPECDFTTNDEPVGAVHDADDGPSRSAATPGSA